MSNRYIIRHHKKQIQNDSQSNKIKKIIINQFPILKSSLRNKFTKNQNYISPQIIQKDIKQKQEYQPKLSLKRLLQINKIKTQRFSQNISCSMHFKQCKQISLKKRFSFNDNGSPVLEKQKQKSQKDHESTFQSEQILPILNKQKTQRICRNKLKIAPVKLIKNPFPTKLYLKKEQMYELENSQRQKLICQYNTNFSRISEIIKVQDEERFIEFQSFEILNL